MKRPPNRAVRLKRIKKELAKLWSLAVRHRDGGKCVMCGKTEYSQAHHWLFRKGHSLALAFNVANGATLCYGCHIGRVHRDGDGDFIMRLGSLMTERIGSAIVSDMQEIAKHPEPISLEDLETLREAFLCGQRARS